MHGADNVERGRIMHDVVGASQASTTRQVRRWCVSSTYMNWLHRSQSPAMSF